MTAPLRSRKPPTADHIARLEAMRAEVLVHLNGDGLSTAWLAERSGVPWAQAASWVIALGAIRDCGRYRLPNVARSRGQTVNH